MLMTNCTSPEASSASASASLRAVRTMRKYDEFPIAATSERA
jgi:hypothetical protein